MTNAFWGVGYADSAYPRLLAGMAVKAGCERIRMGSRGAAKPFLSDMASKEDRTEARVKAGGMLCQSAARLYARRSAGKITLVGKEGEDRFAILSFTLFNLWFAIR